MVYFLRHGLDDEDYVGGWSDVDLVDEGIKQVNISANKIKDMNLGIKKLFLLMLKEQ